jgi:hypothetical protein
VESRSSIRQVQGFTGPSVGFARNAAPDIMDDSSSTEYFKLFLTEFLVTLLVEESNLYCHQYYILQAINSLPLQGIRDESFQCADSLNGVQEEDFNDELVVHDEPY